MILDRIISVLCGQVKEKQKTKITFELGQSSAGRSRASIALRPRFEAGTVESPFWRSFRASDYP